MNAGRDFAKAKRQAQVNADLTGVVWTMHRYGGVWWVERLDSVSLSNGDERTLIYPTGDARAEVR
jgi:hypothetical protein